MDKIGILNALIDYYSGGIKSKFAEKIGVKPQTINTWLLRGSFDTELIYSKCEYVSGDWLLTGGVVMVVTPEVETIHDANGYMRQYFPNGAMIECNKANGNVDVFYKGQKMKSYEDVKIKELEEIQSIYSLWTQRDADIWTNPELRMKYARACAAK